MRLGLHSPGFPWTSVRLRPTGGAAERLPAGLSGDGPSSRPNCPPLRPAQTAEGGVVGADVWVTAEKLPKGRRAGERGRAATAVVRGFPSVGPGLPGLPGMRMGVGVQRLWIVSGSHLLGLRGRGKGAPQG